MTTQRERLAECIYRRNGTLEIKFGFKQRTYYEAMPPGTTLRQAQTKLHEMQTLARKGKIAKRQKDTVADSWKAMLAGMERLRANASTVATYRAALKRWTPLIGSLELQALTEQDIADGRDAMLASGLKGKTVKDYQGSLHRFLSWAVKQKLITENPATGVERAATVPFESHPLNEEQGRRLLEVLLTDSGPHERYLAVLLMIPVRVSELRALRWQDVDLKGGTFSLRRNFGHGDVVQTAGTHKLKIRPLQIPAAAVEVFKAQRQWQLSLPAERVQVANADGLVWTTETMERLAPTTIARQMDRALETAGLPRIRRHDLRHTSATLALKHGINVKVVQGWLGHSTIHQTMNTYAHVMPGEDRAAAELVASLYTRKEAV